LVAVCPKGSAFPTLMPGTIGSKKLRATSFAVKFRDPHPKMSLMPSEAADLAACIGWPTK
jgi:hypothetical protein